MVYLGIQFSFMEYYQVLKYHVFTFLFVGRRFCRVRDCASEFLPNS